MFKKPRSSSRRLGALMVVAASVIAACGSSSTSSPTTAPATTVASTTGGTTAPAETTATTTAAATAKDQVTALLAKDLDFPKPDSSVTPGTHTAAVVTAGLASPGPAAVAKAIKAALGVIGWTAPDAYDGKFTPTEQSTLIQKAVNDKAEVIFLVAITPSAVSASIAAADAAKIPIVCVLCGPQIPSTMVGVENDPVAAGDAGAYYAVANSGPNATIVVYQNTEFASSTAQSAQAAKKAKELCPGCTVETPSLLLAEARQPNAPIFTSLLNDHPKGKLDWVILPFDSPSAALANTASQIGRDDFGIIGFGALAPYVDMVGAGTPPTAKASVTISTPYFGWVAVDQAIRVVTGQKPWVSDKMPVGLIDKSNFSTYPAGAPYVAPKFDYVAEFTKLWGK